MDIVDIACVCLAQKTTLHSRKVIGDISKCTRKAQNRLVVDECHRCCCFKAVHYITVRDEVNEVAFIDGQQELRRIGKRICLRDYSFCVGNTKENNTTE